MEVTMLTLCDGASVRENLLHVIGAGLTAMARPSFPASLDCDIAIFISHTVKEKALNLTLTVREMGKKENVAEIVLNGNLNGVPDGVPAGAAGGTPLAINARDLGLPNAGTYVLQAKLEGGRGLSYKFTVVESKEIPAGPA